jgi:two-component system, LytTR family, sensor kinase
MALIAGVIFVVVAVAIAALLVRGYRRRDLGTSAERVTFETLHTASLAAPPLRDGLSFIGAERAVRHLRTLLGTTAVALTDRSRVLAVDGPSHHHADQALLHAGEVLRTGRTALLNRSDLGCREPDCRARAAVVCPLVDGDVIVGALVAYARDTRATLVRAVEEVAAWVSGQLELGSAEAARKMLMEAELRALRAQISPHFVYNSLTAIASFTRTDPDRARDLLLEFADFTRYALRGGEYASIADELRNTERYLVLEQARFGERLRVSLRVAPEALSIAVPYLVVQPLVENAVRHGLNRDAGVVTVSITVADEGPYAVVTVEDDGVGAVPAVILAALEGADAAARGGAVGAVGLGNVDARLRHVYGDEYGLVVETGPSLGTKVTFRVPKFAPGIRAEG